MNLDKEIVFQLQELAKNYKITSLVLFGSRARGSNFPKSDIDLAVFGCEDFINFYFDCKEMIDTLLKFDIVNMDECDTNSKLFQEVKKDGVILYAEAG